MTDYKNGTTPLYDAVLNEIRIVAVGRGAIGQGELLARLEKKQATQAFRRAIKNLQRQGFIEPFKFLTEKGGQTVGYKVVMELENLPLPGFETYPF